MHPSQGKKKRKSRGGNQTCCVRVGKFAKGTKKTQGKEGRMLFLEGKGNEGLGKGVTVEDNNGGVFEKI